MDLKKLMQKEIEKRKNPFDLGVFGRGVKAGIAETKALYGGAKMAFNALGTPDQKDIEKGARLYEEGMQEAARLAPKGAETLKEVDSAQEFLQWGLFNLGKLVPSMAAGGLGGAVGKATLGRAFMSKGAQAALDVAKRRASKGLVQREADMAARKAAAKAGAKGATVGAMIPSIGMETGGIAGEIYQETGEVKPREAFIGGVLAGSLDALTPGRTFAKLGTREYVPKVLEEAGKTALQEAATETGQEIIAGAAVESGKGRSLLEGETWKDVLDPERLTEAAAVGALGGGVLGVGTALAQKGYVAQNPLTGEIQHFPTRAEAAKHVREIYKLPVDEITVFRRGEDYAGEDGEAEKVHGLVRDFEKALEDVPPETYREKVYEADPEKVIPDLESFIGEIVSQKAKKDIDALAEAKKMEKAGKPREEILRETGWFRADDGKWRKETDDRLTQVITGNLGRSQGKLKEFFEHPELYQAYPWIGEIPVTIQKNIAGEAQWDSQNKIITLNRDYIDQVDPAKVRELLLHETQHIVQDVEGLALGSNPEKESFHVFQSLPKDIRNNLRQAAYVLKIEQNAPGALPRGLVDSAKRLVDWLNDVGYQRYLLKAGEVEARDVEKRHGMSKTERRENPPDIIKDPNVLFSFKDFYSPTLEALGKVKQEKGRGEQMLRMLMKQPGVKEEEIRDLGLDKWLKEKKQVSKREIEGYIRENMPRLREKKLVESDSVYKGKYNLEVPGGKRYVERLVYYPFDLPYSSPHFGQHGENLLGHARTTDRRIDDKPTLFFEELQSDLHQEGQKKGYIEENIDIAAIKEKAIQKADEDIREQKNSYIEDLQFYSGILERVKDPHLYVKRRQDYDNKYGARVQEEYDKISREYPDASKEDLRRLQYKARMRVLLELKDELAQINKDHLRAMEGSPFLNHSTVDRAILNIEQLEKDLVRISTDEYKNATIKKYYDQLLQETVRGYGYFLPSAPFKQSWPMLMAKRMIADAIKEKKKAIAWTTGQTQLARYKATVYKVKKFVSELDIDNDNVLITIETKEGPSINLTVDPDSGKIVDDHYSALRLEDKNIDEVIPRKIADDLISSAPYGKYELDPKDVEIGPKGLRDFYDKVLRNEISKFLKKYGGKVQIKEMDTSDGKVKVWYAEIPEKLRKEYLEKGFPLYSEPEKWSKQEEWSVKKAEKRLERVFGKKDLARIRRSGMLELVTPREFQKITGHDPQKVNGLFMGDSGRIIVHSGSKNPEAVFLHEGTHASLAQEVKEAGLQLVLGDSYQEFLVQIDRLAREGDEIAQKAIERARKGRMSQEARGVIDAKILREIELQERVAYFVEEAAKRRDKTFKRIASKMKAVVRQSRFGQALAQMGISPKLDHRMAVEMAKEALRRANALREFYKETLAEDEKKLKERTPEESELITKFLQSEEYDPELARKVWPKLTQAERQANFERWFGNSQVRNSDGSPMVVYHGTIAPDFDEFAIGNEIHENAVREGSADLLSYLGAHFAEDYTVANRFAMGLYGGRGRREDRYPRVIPVYLRIKNPFVASESTIEANILQGKLENSAEVDQLIEEYVYYKDPSANEADVEEAFKLYEADPIFRQEANNWIIRLYPQGFKELADAYRDMLISEGYDGIRYDNEVEGGIAWIAFRPEDIKSAIGNNGMFGETPKYIYSLSDLDHMPPPPYLESRNFGDFDIDPPQTVRSKPLEKAIYWVQNDLFYLKKAIEKLGNVPIHEDPYLAATLYPGRVRARTLEMQERFLKPIFKLMHEGDISPERLDEYLYARHALEANERLRKINAKRFLNHYMDAFEAEQRKRIREGMRNIRKNKKDIFDVPEEYYKLLEQELDQMPEDVRMAWLAFEEKPSGMSDGEAVRILAQNMGDPKIQEIGEIFDQMNRWSLDEMFTSGLITEEEYNAMSEAYRHWAPLMREGFEDVFRGRGKGISIGGKETLVRAGSLRRAENIFANAVARAQRTIIRSEKQKIGEALYNLVKAHEDPDFWKVDIEEPSPTIDADGSIRMYPRIAEDDNTIRVKLDGKVHKIWFNPTNDYAKYIAFGLKRLDSLGGQFINWLSVPMRWLSMVNTTLSPEFTVTNFLRDVLTAQFNLSDTEGDEIRGRIMGDIKNAMHGLRMRFRSENWQGDEWAKWADQFQRDGGMIGWVDQYRSIEHLNRKLQNMMKRETEGAWKFLNEVEKFVEDYNMVVENAMRLAFYKNVVEKLEAKGMTPEEARKLAAAQAKELTVNFNRKGAAGPAINALWLFANAGIQGTARIVQTMMKSKKGQQMAISAMLLAFSLSTLQRLLGDEDEDGIPLYDKIPDYVKERNMVFLLPDDTVFDDLPLVKKVPGTKRLYLKIPMPYGYNSLWVLGDEAAKAAYYRDAYDAKKGAVHLAKTVFEAFSPIQGASLQQFVAPTLLDPIIQIGANETFYGGKLYPESTFRGFEAPDHTLYWRNARSFSKEAARLMAELTGGDDFREGWIDIHPDTLDLWLDTLMGSAGKFVADTAEIGIGLMKDGSLPPLDQIPFARKIFGRLDYSVDRQLYEERAQDVWRAVKRLRESGEKTPPVLMYEPLKSTERQLRQLSKLQQGASDERWEELELRKNRLRMKFNKLYADRVIQGWE